MNSTTERISVVRSQPIPHEEHRHGKAGSLTLGWTLLDPVEPDRPARVQAELLGRHHSRHSVLVQQVHLTRCVVIAEGDKLPSTPERADGVITNRRDLLVGVSAADCLPLFVVGQSGLAVLHAGWRGVLGGILPLARQRLAGAFGPGSGEPELVIGPGIGPCCFEVSPAVWTLFPLSSRVAREGKRFVDLPAAVIEQWQLAGGGPVVRFDRCTSCSSPALHSYRRDGGAGRNLAYLCYA